ncbi:MAG TPA: hypothetical protein VHE56_08910 [Mycobacteriales bacterium]|nr:hypothetical protein [Mycobacteriales bacterium]
MTAVTSTPGVRRLPVLGVIAALALTAACGGGSSPKGAGKPNPTTTKSTAGKPGPHYVSKGNRTLQVKQVAQIGTPGKGVAMLMKIGKPRVSRTHLSPSYGDNPIHGYFVNFPVKIYNDGVKPVLIDRLNFWVDTPGLGKVNTNEGASPYSGAKTQLDTTELASGQGVSNFLTFDVSTPHGKFVYGPHNKLTVAWRF